MTSVDQVYATWKQQYAPSHTSSATAAISIDEKDAQKFVDDFVRLAERDYPNHQISGKLISSASANIAFDPIVAP